MPLSLLAKLPRSERSRDPQRRLTDPCGKFLPALVYYDLRDRFGGHGERAKARWGAIDRPAFPGKLIWIVAGSTRESVRLGVEIARAILAKRLDVGITFTFEREHPELVTALASSSRVSCGYAPSDYAGSMHAVWRRLLPFAVILAGVAPRHNMLRLCAACRHAVLVAPPSPVAGRFERIYPAHTTAHEGAHIAPAADLDVLLVPARSGSDAGRIAEAAPGRGIFVWHGSDADAAKRLFALFRGHLPRDVMVVSGPACDALTQYSAATLRLGTWNGEPLAPERLVLADRPVSLSTVAADAWGVHYALPDCDALWQSLAAGAVVSAVESALPSSPNARAAIRDAADENALIARWAELARDDEARAALSAASRNAYATERELAYATVTELLERVCAWH